MKIENFNVFGDWVDVKWHFGWCCRKEGDVKQLIFGNQNTRISSMDVAKEGVIFPVCSKFPFKLLLLESLLPVTIQVQFRCVWIESVAVRVAFISSVISFQV